MMFAVGPLVIPFLVGGVLLIAVIAWFAYKWLKEDPHRDMVIFMGPKEQGKTELKFALLKKGFNENRQGTGRRVFKEKLIIDDDDIGRKKIVTLDCGGDGPFISGYVSEVGQYIAEKRPEYVLIVLVMKRSFLQQDVVSVSDKLGEYLDFITKAFDNNDCKPMEKRYHDGFWAYAIATTHCDKLTSDEEQKLSQIEERVGKRYSGKLRRMVDRKRDGCFELSEKKYRNQAIVWIVNILKAMHEE